MKLIVPSILFAVATLCYYPVFVQAGPLNGPTSSVVNLPARQNTYFDVAFVPGEPATVSITSDAADQLELFIYDSDGHIIVGNGSANRKSASLNVYREGTLRVHIRNLGSHDITCVLRTN